MLNWFSCKPASVEPVAIDRKPKTLTDGVQDPEVQRQLDAVRRIIDAYSDDVGSIAWEHTKAIREVERIPDRVHGSALRRSSISFSLSARNTRRTSVVPSTPA